MRYVCFSLLQRAGQSRLLTRIVATLFSLSVFATSQSLADDVFIYSSETSIRGINITQQTENFLTSSPFVTGLNAVSVNTANGLVYYGSGTSVYRWNPALGNGPVAHNLMNDFSSGAVTAPIRNIDSTAGSYLNGKYYVGSERDDGYIEDLYELTLSTDGRQVLSATALDLPGACNCTGVQLGGFGDVAAFNDGGDVVVFGSTAALSGASTQAGRWRFNLTQGTWQLLAAGTGGQMSNSTTGDLYSNSGNDIRVVDKVTGILAPNTLFTTSQAIYDFSGGYSIDFGDAPDSYGSAFHRLSNATASVYLGAIAPDDEAGSLNSAIGGSDIDGDDTAGIDDEDSVSNLPDIDAAAGSYSISLSCTAGTPVSAWIDLDRSGVFDSSERNSNYPVTCASGQTQLTWSALQAATDGDTFVRIRTSTNRPSIAGPTGQAPDGEVEDHPVRVNQALTGSCPVGSTASTILATDLPQSIGPNAGTETISTINVTNSASVTDVNVLNVVADHTAVRDLIIDLIHGSVTTRLYGPTCNRRNDVNIGFDDAASGTPPCAPTDGNTYPAVGSLSDFNGTDVMGDWTLRILDRRRNNGGQLNAWGLELCTAPFVIENPDIILGKSASVVGREVTITMTARNNGDIDLSALQITDDLDATFGAGNYSVVGFPQLGQSPAGYTANVNFTGTGANTQLVSGNGVVPPDGELSVVFKVAIGNANTAVSPESYSNQATATATSPNGTTATDLSGNGLDTSTDTDTPTPIVMDPEPIVIGGRVFFDSAPTLATSHDGLINSGELMSANRLVSVFDANNNVLLGTTQTNGEGIWNFSIDPGFVNQPLRVELVADTQTLSISESPHFTTGPVTDGTVLFTPLLGVKYLDINFGVIATPLLTLDQSASATPNGAVRYAHTYTAPSHGDLTTSLSSIENPANPPWNKRLIEDANCNGVIDALESDMPTASTVSPGQIICLIVDIFVPSNATAGAIQQAVLQINFFPSDTSGTGHKATASVDNRDITSVSNVNQGVLVLDKSVRNVSRSESASVSNAAQPGDTLEYIISYTNQGSGPLSDLVINDEAPAFTTVQSSSVECSSTPGSVSCTPGVAGAQLQWDFSGSLGAGESGAVRYSVLVE